jgi:hypothetical protein
MAQYVFGSGKLYGLDSLGAPLEFGVLQDVSLEFSSDIKQLNGQLMFPVAIGRAHGKVEGKASFGEIDLRTYNSMFFNSSAGVSAAKSSQAINEAGAVPVSVAYTITVANAVTFELDLGVTLVATGQKLKQVPTAATPATGEYKVAAGVYTFNVAQASAAVIINYLFTTAASGQKLNITNDLMGQAPTFGIVLSETFQGKTMVCRLYACVSDKLSLPFKQDDFKVDELSFMAQDNGTGSLGYLSISG